MHNLEISNQQAYNVLETHVILLNAFTAAYELFAVCIKINLNLVFNNVWVTRYWNKWPSLGWFTPIFHSAGLRGEYTTYRTDHLHVSTYKPLAALIAYIVETAMVNTAAIRKVAGQECRNTYTYIVDVEIGITLYSFEVMAMGTKFLSPDPFYPNVSFIVQYPFTSLCLSAGLVNKHSAFKQRSSTSYV